MSGIIVLKIGGSSLATAEGFKQAVEVIKTDPRRRYVVVSAPGTCPGHDVKVTDLLISLRNTEHPEETVRAVKHRFFEIAQGLGYDEAYCHEIEGMIDEFVDRFKRLRHPHRHQYIERIGETLSGMLLAKQLGPDWTFVDPTNFIRLTENGHYDAAATKRAFRRFRLPERAVIAGFYGLDARKRVRTFGRGGSEISGAIVAALVGAALYENATDVPGVYMVNPKRLPEPRVPKVISGMTYSQMQEMAYCGASVLHHEAIYPVREAGIPTRLFGLMTPKHEGTHIYIDGDVRAHTSCPFIGITDKQGFTMFSIKKPGMNMDDGFTFRTLGVLDGLGVGPDHFTTGLDTLDIIIPDEKLGEKRDLVLNELKRTCDADVELTSEIGIACIIGKDLGKNLMEIGDILKILASLSIKPIFFELGGNRTTLVFGVAQVSLPETARAAHDYILQARKA